MNRGQGLNRQPLSKGSKIVIKWVIVAMALYLVVPVVYRRSDMRNTIKEKSHVEIPYLFKVVENEIFHSPMAFDSDYTWYYEIKVSEEGLESITAQIEKSKFFDTEGSLNYSSPIYDSLTAHNLKGYWTTEKNGYRFYPAEEEWSERTEIEIDRKNRTIKVELIHL